SEVIEMGYTRKRVGKDGKTRFMALYYDAQGKRRSAGTHAAEKEAAKAWQKAEVKIGEGTPWDPRRGRQTFRRYVEEQWLPHHRIEDSTRQGYCPCWRTGRCRWWRPRAANCSP